MKRLTLNITFLVFMALGSMNAMAHDLTVEYCLVISHDARNACMVKCYSRLELVQEFQTNGDPLAFALSLQSVERSLEDADIAGSVDAIVASISEKFGAALRD